MYHCEDSLLNDPHPICTRAQIDALKTMNKEVTKRKGERPRSSGSSRNLYCTLVRTDFLRPVHLASFCTYLNKLEWEYKFPPRWVPTTCDLDAVSFYNDSFPSGEHEAMITTTLAFRLVEAVDEITSVAWYPAWVQSLILTSRVWNLRTGNEKHIKVWREMAAKSQWVGRVRLTSCSHDCTDHQATNGSLIIHPGPPRQVPKTIQVQAQGLPPSPPRVTQEPPLHRRAG